MAFTLTSLESEHVGETLDTVRFWLGGLRVPLAGLDHRLGTHPILRAGKRQNIAEFGRIEKDAGAKTQGLAIIEIYDRDGNNTIVFDLNGGGFGPQVQVKAPRIEMRLEQRHHRRDRHFGLESHARDPTVAGIEMGLLPGLAGERPIMVAQRIAQLVIAGGAAEILDVIVLVESGDASGGQLPADPVGFLDEMDDATPA